MQDYEGSSNALNNFKVDMATVSKTLGEFGAREGECVERWTACVHTTGKIFNLNDKEIIGAVVLALRAEAREWALGLLEKEPHIQWNDLRQRMEGRFASQKETADVISRFFTSPVANDYKTFNNMIKDADLMLRRGCLSEGHLMKQVISRSPAEMKSMLIQIAYDGCDWETFRKRAENSSWMAFPDNVINVVVNEQREEDLNVYAIAARRKLFCHLHGEGNHLTKDCDVVKLVESKGWRRNKKRITQITPERFNKDNSSYFLSKNPFYCTANVRNRDGKLKSNMKILIDTGADVSVISKKLLPQNTVINKKKQVSLKTANDQRIEVLGQVEKLNLELGNKSLEFNPIITKEHPKEYAILGADAIRSNGKEIIDIITEKLSKVNAQINTIEFEKKYKDLFKEGIDEMTACKVIKHAIVTKKGTPVVQRNFQIPKLIENEIDKEIEQLKKSGIIENSNSPWASRIVPVRKKDGDLRICIDYRALNEMTIKDEYPIPRIDEILDELADAKYFSTIDATKGYYQIRIEDKDREKTAFRWKGGFYQFTRMPFGLCNAPATFQRCMDSIFRDISWKYVIPYLDDIIIYSKSKEEHEKHIEQTLKILREAGIVLNQKKCKFFEKEIKILGNIVAQNSVRPDPEKIKALQEFSRPETIKELRSFLGLINYCRGFIPNLAMKSLNLTNILRGETKRSVKKICWTDVREKEYRLLKKELTNETWRAQPDFTKSFILTTDASEYAIGAILSQKQKNGNEKMIYAFSKKLDKSQVNYSVTDKELLAVIKSTEHFRRYLIGRKFKLRTDHKAIEFIKTARNPCTRLLRWGLKLQEFDFEVEYIKGSLNGADLLSRGNPSQLKINNILSNNDRLARKQILQKIHILLGHGSKNAMKFFIQNRIKWEGIYKEVDDLVENCSICLKGGEELCNTKNNVIKTFKKGDLWEVDLLGRIPSKNGKNKFILVATDHFTKWVETKILNSKDSFKIKRAIKEIIIDKHGIPRKIYSDNGKEFMNTEIQKFSRELGVEWIVNSPGHHNALGAVERVNRTLMGKLRKLCHFGEKPWEKFVEQATLAINLSPNRALGTCPHVMMQGRNMEFIINDTVTNPKIDISEVMSKLRQKRKSYDREIQSGRKFIARNIGLGEPVLIFKNPPGNKLKAKWHNGYKVTGFIGEDSYVISNGKRNYRLNKKHVKIDSSKRSDGGVVNES